MWSTSSTSATARLLLVSSLETTRREVVRHCDADVDIPTFIIVVSAELKLDILIDLELDVIALVFFITELKTCIVVSVGMMTVTDQISIVFVVRLIRVCIVVTEVRMLVVDGLLANLEEVVRVKLESTHLLTVG